MVSTSGTRVGTTSTQDTASDFDEFELEVQVIANTDVGYLIRSCDTSDTCGSTCASACASN